MKNDPILSLISLCAKGRNVVSGAFATEKAVKEGKASLVIVTEDASDNTRKKFKDMCEYRDIPFYLYSDMDSMGRSVGCEMRTSIAVVDEGLAVKLIEKLDVVKANGGNK